MTIIFHPLTTFSAGTIFTTIIAVYIAKHPEVVDKWLSLIARVLIHVWSGAKYISIRSYIQGNINSYVRRLGTDSSLNFPRIAVRLVAQEGKEEILWEDGEAIIVMKDQKSRNKNLVRAAHFFTSSELLKKPKNHLSNNQKTSLDLFATKKVLESISAAAVEQFMSDYFQPATESENIRNYIKQYLPISEVGLFFPILIQELIYLGNKVFLETPTSEVIEEVNNLVNFLEKFSHREIGDTSIPNDFHGKYMRCAIRIVASKEVRERGDDTAHVNIIEEAIARNLENIYVIGNPDKKNVKYMMGVIKKVQANSKNLLLSTPRLFKGQIKQGGRKIKVETYFLHLHNPDAVKFIYDGSEFQNDTD